MISSNILIAGNLEISKYFVEIIAVVLSYWRQPAGAGTSEERKNSLQGGLHFLWQNPTYDS